MSLAKGDLVAGRALLLQSRKADSMAFRDLAHLRVQMIDAPRPTDEDDRTSTALAPLIDGEAVTIIQPSLGLEWLEAMCQYDVGSEGPLSQAIRRMKRNQFKSQQTTKAFGHLLSEWFSTKKGRRAWPDVIVPVPAVPGRRRHDIADLLAEPIAHDLCIPSSRLIEFVSYPENLRGLNHLQRYEALSGCFGLARGAKVRDLRVVLVDDVLTHGTTLHEIAKVLKSNGALAVSGLVVGVTRSHCPNCSRQVTATKQDVEDRKSDRRRVSSGRRFRIKIGSEWQ